MSEQILFTCYAILATLGIALGTVTIVTDNFPKLQRKPFNCMYCMTWWAAITVTLLVFGVSIVGFAMIPVIQIVAYIIYQRLI